MTALHSVQSTHQRSALPTVNHTRSVLQKLHAVAERPMPPAAVVTLSPQATRDSQLDPQTGATSGQPVVQDSWDAAETQDAAPPESPPPEEPAPERSPAKAASQGQASIDGLTQDQRDMVTELAQRDREVHTHEAAHQAAGGGLVGAASYTYQEGPDGRSYAIGGECPIQIPASDNPSEMISIAERVRAAALAPANPSGQDMAVANAAVQMEAQARQQLAQQQAQQQQAPTARQPGQSQPPGEAQAAPGEAPSEQASSGAPDAAAAGRAMAAYARTSGMAA